MNDQEKAGPPAVHAPPFPRAAPEAREVNGVVGWRKDFNSKLLDGLLPALVLYLLFMLVVLGLKPIRAEFGGPGLLIYALGLLGVAMFSLQRALVQRFSEATRAWYGLAAGLLAWSVAEIGGLLDGSGLLTPRGVILLLMVTLVTALLWRAGQPLGVRFFLATFLANWGGDVAVSFLRVAAEWGPAVRVFYLGIGLVSGLVSLGVLLWIFFRSERRVQRIWASLWVILFAVGAVYIFRGSLF